MNIEQNKSLVVLWAKNICLWLFYFVFIATSGLASAVAIYLFFIADRDIRKYAGYAWLESVLNTWPLFWLAAVIVFLFFACASFKKTAVGRRFNILTVIIISLAVSLAAGYYLIGLERGMRMDIFFAENWVSYRRLNPDWEAIWSQPKKGLLAGIVINSSDKENLRLIDFKNKIWTVNLENATVRGSKLPGADDQIKIIGRIVDDTGFVADEVRFWNGVDEIKR